MTRVAWRWLVVAALAVAPVIMAAPAQAHGDDETQEGYVLVQQALAHLAHETNAEGIDLAMEKVDDALETDDQEGVDVAEVKQAKVAVEAGQVEHARALLEDSIADAIAAKPLATGYGSGTGLVPDRLDGRGPLDGADWFVLGLSVAVSGLGVWLSIKYRPHESMSALRMLLGTTPDDKRRTQ